MPEMQIGHLHVSVNNIQNRPTSNVMNVGQSYKQMIQVCTEMQFPDPNQAVYYVQEFVATWPKDASTSTSGHGYSLSLVGTKSIITRAREVMKLFYPNMDPDTYNIDGCKLGLTAGVCTINNSEIYRMKNECVFTNLYEYY